MLGKEFLQEIEKKSNEIVGLINEGVQWVNNFLQDEKLLECRYQLKKQRRQINKIRAVVGEKPTIALFGASQVGKSYMVNNLLYNQENKLLVYDSSTGQQIDFIKDINPEGHGNEATGAITRFTSKLPDTKHALPVHVKLFDIKDVVCLICDTFYNDYVESNNIELCVAESQMREKLEQIRKMKIDTPHNMTADDDIYEIKEYLDKCFGRKGMHQLTQISQSGYWDLLAENIAFIPPKYFRECFSILWNFNESLSEVFDSSFATLESIQFSKYVHVGFDALSREGKASIVNVQTLKNFFGSSDLSKSFTVETSEGKQVSVRAPQLCFLTEEIVLCVDKTSVENRPFIKDVDIIDFPGARSRPDINRITQESIQEMMLRGKVSYLFNRYSSNYKVNVLVACMRTSQSNVKEVPSLINQWIHENVGHTPEQRSASLQGQLAPLFIIFTWWNTQLEFKAATDTKDPSERLKKLFEDRFREEIISDFSWSREWIADKQKTDRFKNFFLLRDFKMSENIFNSNGVELDEFRNPPQAEFYETYKQKFIEYHQSKNAFFENPAFSFDEASTPNKDGSMLIIQNLIPASQKNNTLTIYLNHLQQSLKQAIDVLQKNFHSENADEQIRMAAQKASELQLKMDILFGQNAYHFGNFLEHLMMKEDEILSFYHELLKSDKLIKSKDTNTYTLLRIQNPDLSTLKSFEENLEILRANYNMPSAEATKKHFTEVEKIDLQELFYGEIYDLKRNSVVLAEFARDYWFNSKLNHTHFQHFVEMGFEKNQLSSMYDTLRVSFERHHIDNLIAESIRDYVDVNKKIEKAEEMIAHITIGIINRFVTSVGWDYYTEAERSDIRNTNAANSLQLSIPSDVVTVPAVVKLAEGDASIRSLDNLIDYMDNITTYLNKKPVDPRASEFVPMLNNYKQWIRLMKIAFISNCEIPTYNVAANAALGGILKRFDEYSFDATA